MGKKKRENQGVWHKNDEKFTDYLHTNSQNRAIIKTVDHFSTSFLCEGQCPPSTGPLFFFCYAEKAFYVLLGTNVHTLCDDPLIHPVAKAQEAHPPLHTEADCEHGSHPTDLGETRFK